MTEPCNKGPDIDNLNKKVDSLIDAQRATSQDLKQAIEKLTAIIMADIETRAEVEQLKKDREILFNLTRGVPPTAWETSLNIFMVFPRSKVVLGAC